MEIGHRQFYGAIFPLRSCSKLNLRIVLVNAQIKAMISLIEAFISFAFVIMVYFTVRGTYGSMAIMVFL